MLGLLLPVKILDCKTPVVRSSLRITSSTGTARAEARPMRRSTNPSGPPALYRTFHPAGRCVYLYLSIFKFLELDSE
jgi:hypothetical protein